MKKIILAAAFLFAIFSGIAFAEESGKAPEDIFRKANALYASGDYTKAIEAYLSILDSGVESGNIYYNIGNSFFKLNKIGYAILCYDRAIRLKPRDSDIRSNLEYARSLVDDAGYGSGPENEALRFLNIPYRALSLNAFLVLVTALYLLASVLLLFSILNKTFRRRARAVTIFTITLFIVSMALFGARYYNEEILKHGIVVVKSADARYEPIDKSVTYFKVKEGCEVLVLKSRDDWRQIKRADGKIGWVNRAAVDVI